MSSLSRDETWFGVQKLDNAGLAQMFGTWRLLNVVQKHASAQSLEPHNFTTSVLGLELRWIAWLSLTNDASHQYLVATHVSVQERFCKGLDGKA